MDFWPKEDLEEKVELRKGIPGINISSAVNKDCKDSR